jgi:DNA polymerase-3 subunit alpha/error-prone DNA polymerase
VRSGKSQGFMHVGRGSGANSIVIVLGITDICPIELDLYFERFLNENRKSLTLILIGLGGSAIYS